MPARVDAGLAAGDAEAGAGQGEAPRVLITGATGFIGNALARAWRASGAQVGLLARGVQDGAGPGTGTPTGPSGAGYHRYPIDLRDGAELRRAVSDFRPSLCYHLASVPDAPEDHGQISAALEVNTLGTVNLLEAILQAGRCLTVIGDSVKVYGNVPVPYRADQATEPDGSYAISKLAAWRLALMYLNLRGLPTVAIRPTLVYGPGQGWNVFSYVIAEVQRGAAAVRLMGGTQTRDPLYIADAVAAFMAASRVRRADLGRAIPVGGGHEIAVRDLATQIVRGMDARIEVECVESAMRPTEMMRSFCDNEDVRRMLGWSPRWSLAGGIEATLNALAGRQTGLTPAADPLVDGPRTPLATAALGPA